MLYNIRQRDQGNYRLLKLYQSWGNVSAELASGTWAELGYKSNSSSYRGGSRTLTRVYFSSAHPDSNAAPFMYLEKPHHNYLEEIWGIFPGTHPFFYCSMNKRAVLLNPKNLPWIRHCHTAVSARPSCKFCMPNYFLIVHTY